MTAASVEAVPPYVGSSTFFNPASRPVSARPIVGASIEELLRIAFGTISVTFGR